MKNNSLVSVIMSVYNGEKHLRSAVDSILAQSYTEFEFIIVNDCSDDASREILESYKDSRVKLIHNSSNLGLAASLNVAIGQTSGSYLVRMDADDISLPNRLSTLFAFMEDHPELHVAGSSVRVMDGEGGIKGSLKPPRRHDTIKASVLWNSSLIHPSVIIRSSFMRDGKITYNNDFRASQDYDLWERMLFQHQGRFANVPSILLLYRVHQESVSINQGTRQLHYADLVRERCLLRFLPYVSKSTLEAYSRSVTSPGSLSRTQLFRLSVLYGDLWKSNHKKGLLESFHFKQNPLYRMGWKGLRVYLRKKNYRCWSPVKRITFVLNSLACSLAPSGK